MTTQDLSIVPMRASLGATMLYHGAEKLRGAGPEQSGQMFEQLGLRPGRPLAVLTGWSEVLAGAALVLGLATRAGALAVLVTQGMAIAKVHRPKGFSNLAGGYEFNLALMAVALGIFIAGPGQVSAHGAIARRGKRRPWFRARQPSRTECLLLALR